LYEQPDRSPLFADRHTGLVLITTFGLTLLKNLTFDIVTGRLVATLLALSRRAIPSKDGP
jgi:hypothetical protein